MALRVKKQRILPIGVDFGSGCLKIAQLATGPLGLELLAVGSAELSGEQAGEPNERMQVLLANTRRILASSGFRGRKAALALPAAAVISQIVKVPFGMPPVVDAAVREELRDRLPLPVSDAVIRHFPTGAGADGLQDLHERLAVVVSRRDVKAYLDLARKAQLDVVSVDVEMCALAECFARLMRRAADASRTLLLLDIGAESTQLVLTRGSRIAFARNIDFGGRRLDARIAELMGVDHASAAGLRRQMIDGDMDVAATDDLMRLLSPPIVEASEHISECIKESETIRHGPAPERIVFAGGQAHDPKLCEAIAQRLQLPAEMGDPLTGIRRPEAEDLPEGIDLRQPHPSWAVVIGLGLGAAA